MSTTTTTSGKGTDVATKDDHKDVAVRRAEARALALAAREDVKRDAVKSFADVDAVVPFAAGTGFTPDTGADGYKTGAAMFSRVMSLDPTEYARIVKGMSVKSGADAANREETITRLFDGARYADAAVTIGEMNADLYREITVGLLTAAGESRKDVARKLGVSPSRVSHYGKVGRVIVAIGDTGGQFTFAQLRTAASTYGAKSLTAVLESGKDADTMRNAVATIIADGVTARKAKAVTSGSSGTTGTGATAPADDVTETPAEDVDDVTGEDAGEDVPADVVTPDGDDDTLGSDVARFVKLLTDARNLAPVLLARADELTPAMRGNIQRAFGTFVDGMGELDAATAE